MARIIETNLILVGKLISDHQSRVIEVDNWESYINEMKEAKSVNRLDIIGTLHGISVPRESTTCELVYDDFHLSCVFTSPDKITKKLSYLINEN